jgi:DNA processing protein
MDLSQLKRNEDTGDLFDDELSAWLAFSQLSGPGIGVSKVRSLLEYFQSLKDAWDASASDLRDSHSLTFQNIEKFVKVRQSVDREDLLKKMRAAKIKALDIYHPLYPPLLREIHDPPIVLYMKGRLHPDDLRRCCGVVGTRRPTAYGQRHAKEIARGLAAHGATIVSGMAVGIDSFAHYGAIEGKGRTIAVLPCGADICYPSSNKPLYTKLVEGENGAVVSEFAPGTKVDDWRFPARNRIISGISSGLVVIEGAEDSGSLITARLAFEQSREVFALPGRVDSPMSKGTHFLIYDSKAHILWKDYYQILEGLNWVSKSEPGKSVPTIVELFGRERELFDLISTEPVHFDYLVEKMGMNAGELSATLTMLELAGIVTRLPGDWYARQEAIATL